MSKHARTLRIEGLVKAYGNAEPVLGPVSLDIRPGELTMIIGRSGCGKSTLLRCLAGLEHPSAGSVLLGGQPIRPHDVGFVFQEPRLMPWLTVRDNVAFGLRHLTPKSRRARVAEVLDIVGLGHAADRLPKALSGGMAQRAALARALGPAPTVLLLDEPFSALDALLRTTMQSHLRTVLERLDATMVMITHDLGEAIAIGDRIVALNARPGRITGDWRIDHTDLEHPKAFCVDQSIEELQATIKGTLGIS